MSARVAHATFGRGTVTGHRESAEGKETMVQIQFDEEGEKLMSPRFAKITLLDDSEFDPAPVCWVHPPLPSDFEGDGIRPQPFELELFVDQIRQWGELVTHFEKWGIEDDSFSLDVAPRDILFELLTEHPAFRRHDAARELANIDQRYYAIEHRYPPGHSPGSSAPSPENLAVGHWWKDSPPMPRMHPEGVDKDYDALKALAYELVNKFAPCGERIAKGAGCMYGDTYADFIMELISPAQLRHGNEQDVAACSDFLRERCRKLGYTLSRAQILISRSAMFEVRLRTANPSMRLEAPLKKGALQSYEWMWPCATSD